MRYNFQDNYTWVILCFRFLYCIPLLGQGWIRQGWRNLTSNREGTLWRISLPAGALLNSWPLYSEVFAFLLQEVIALHTAIFSSLYPDPTAAIASCRLNARASFKVMRRLSISSSCVFSWQFTPGISSTQPIHQSPDCLIIAVYSV